MAMLAGPRQRKRYNLVPKGKALFEDGDRFGTKMLEKMGWSKGKGLGSQLHGQQEFIRIRYKNDANGLGYEDRDDQWTEHEKHFNGLLETLHAGDSNTASGDDAADDCAPRVGFGFEKSKTNKDKLKDKFSGQSLEERSKSSKARVHYKKFTKGKDMTQYSEKDLANIFGKKATADDNDFYSQLPSFNAGNEAADDDENKQEFELGTHTVKAGLSVTDYFKMKMEALKNKRATVEKKEETELSGDEQEEIAEADAANENDDEGNRKKKKKSKKQKLEDVSEKENRFEGESEEADLKAEVCENGHDEPVVSKPKKKKSKKADLCDTESNSVEVITLQDETSEEQRPKKKKKKKSADESDSDQVTEQSGVLGEKETTQAEEAVTTNPSKKKKSKKNATETETEPEVDSAQVCTESVADEVPEKRKKNKKRKAEESVDSLASVVENPSKKKKTKGCPEDEPALRPESTEKPEEKKKQSLEANAETPIASRTSKKSKKKNRHTSADAAKVSSQNDISSLIDSLDTYTISTFCAEKFRNIDLTSFRGSNISDQVGYGLSEDLKLKIVNIESDQSRITELWSGRVNKYKLGIPKKEIYKKYMREVKRARREKKKFPKMKVKPLHRLSAFQLL